MRTEKISIKPNLIRDLDEFSEYVFSVHKNSRKTPQKRDQSHAARPVTADEGTGIAEPRHSAVKAHRAAGRNVVLSGAEDLRLSRRLNGRRPAGRRRCAQ